MDCDVLGFPEREIHMHPPSSGTLRKLKLESYPGFPGGWLVMPQSWERRGLPSQSPQALCPPRPLQQQCLLCSSKTKCSFPRMQPDTRPIMQSAGVLTQLGHVDQAQWRPSGESPWLVYQTAQPDAT